MLKKIALGFLIAVVGFVAFVASRPSTLRVERSLTMSAPPEVAFALINDFHAWASWSPWEKLDPDMVRSHGGAPEGVGAVYSWHGNEEVGKGRMTITSSQPAEHVAIRLEFLEPWEATNQTTFELTPAGDGVTVSWAMTGESNFVAKAASVFMDMDAMIGEDFERGLSTMKQVAEERARREAAERRAREQDEATAAALDAAEDAAAAGSAAAAPAPATPSAQP